MAKKPARTAPSAAPAKKPAASAPRAGNAPNLAALDAAWGERAAAPPSTGGGFSIPPVPDGDFIVRLSAVKVTSKKKEQKFTDGTVVPAGTPSLNHSYIIIASPPGCQKTDDSGEKPDGCRLSVFDEVSTREIMEGRTCLDLAMDRLKLTGVDCTSFKATQLPQLCQSLSDPKHALGQPFLSARVVNKFSPGKKKGPDGEPITYHNQNIYLQQVGDTEIAVLDADQVREIMTAWEYAEEDIDAALS